MALTLLQPAIITERTPDMSFPGLTAGGHTWSSQHAPGWSHVRRMVSDTSFTFGAPNWGTWYFTEGVVGVAYDQAWYLAGSSPTTYSLASGALPPGLAIGNVAGNEGRLFGTPTLAGTYTFSILATNSVGSVTQSFTVVVIAAPSGGEKISTFVC